MKKNKLKEQIANLQHMLKSYDKPLISIKLKCGDEHSFKTFASAVDFIDYYMYKKTTVDLVSQYSMACYMLDKNIKALMSIKVYNEMVTNLSKVKI